MHIDGVDNKVADCLFHYYENDMSDNTHLENCNVFVVITAKQSNQFSWILYKLKN